MSQNMKIKWGWVIALIIIIGLVVYGVIVNNRPSELDDFAQCLAEKEAIFYGAFWCPHCQAQKEMFGNSSKYLPYIECSTPDGKSQKKVCDDAGIEGYPTWVFADGSRLSGEVELEALAAKTGCELLTN